MSLKRECYFCGKPVDIRRQMSTFCSSRCEALERYIPGGKGRPLSSIAARTGMLDYKKEPPERSA